MKKIWLMMDNKKDDKACQERQCRVLGRTMGRTKRDGRLLRRMLGMLGGDTCLNKSLNKNKKFWLKAKRK